MSLGFRCKVGALAAATAGLLCWFAIVYCGDKQALLSYLAAYLFWLGLSLGSLAFLMLHSLTGGAWGIFIRPGLEAATRLLPLVALLFLPLGLGARNIYPWASREAALASPLLQHKSWYLNTAFFQTRAAIYFGIWLALAYAVTRRPSDLSAPIPLPRISAPGLVLYGLTVTFAAVDWVMSLTPEWHSTAFGLQVGVGELLGAMALAVVCAALASSKSNEEALAGRLHDLGNWLLMLTLIWSYLAFMQFLTVWMGDLPREIAWYLPRIRTDWYGLSLAVVLFQGLFPFLLLLFRRLKRSAPALTAIAGVILGGSLAQGFWLVLPSLRPQGFALRWTDAAAVIGIGGLWIGGWLWQLGRAYAHGVIEEKDRG